MKGDITGGRRHPGTSEKGAHKGALKDVDSGLEVMGAEGHRGALQWTEELKQWQA